MSAAAIDDSPAPLRTVREARAAALRERLVFEGADSLQGLVEELREVGWTRAAVETAVNDMLVSGGGYVRARDGGWIECGAWLSEAECVEFDRRAKADPSTYLYVVEPSDRAAS